MDFHVSFSERSRERDRDRVREAEAEAETVFLVVRMHDGFVLIAREILFRRVRSGTPLDISHRPNMPRCIPGCLASFEFDPSLDRHCSACLEMGLGHLSEAKGGGVNRLWSTSAVVYSVNLSRPRNLDF